MSIFKTLFAVSRVATGAGFNLLKGASATVKDVGKVVECLANKDLEGSCHVLGRRIERGITGLGIAVQSASELLDECGKSRQNFWREENIQKLTTVATVALGAGLGGHLLSSDSADLAPDTEFDSNFSATHELSIAHYGHPDLPYDAVETGVFVGDDNDLSALIRAGELENTTHLDSDEISRDVGVRQTFLSSHGFDSVPDGYEVHHVVPLSEGGPDSTDNMILLEENDHDTVTAAHRAFYGWNKS